MQPTPVRRQIQSESARARASRRHRYAAQRRYDPLTIPGSESMTSTNAQHDMGKLILRLALGLLILLHGIGKLTGIFLRSR